MVLNVAITGHRSAALTSSLVRTLRPVVYVVFRQLREASLRAQQSQERFCSSTAARLSLHTPLASGADQIAAICARSSGYFVRALLPFEASEYRQDFAHGDELEMFEQALEAADEITALPGRRSNVEQAYLLVGQSLVRTADILVAIWDGEPARGLGGTANVVSMALQNSTPVIHLWIDHVNEQVHMRTLVEGQDAAGFGASLHDPLVYSQVVESALALQDRAGALEPVGEPVEELE